MFKHIAEFCNQNGWKWLSNKYYCIYFGKFIWFVLGSFLKNSVNVFHVLILNTVCLKKCWLNRVIAECYYVNLLIFLTILGSLVCLRHIKYTFIKKLTQYWLPILFQSKEVLFHLLLLRTKYADQFSKRRMGGSPPSSPLVVPLIRHQTYTCFLKIIVNTSQKIFNYSIKIAAESVFSPAIRTVLHMSAVKSFTKILKQSLKSQENNLHNFIIN